MFSYKLVKGIENKVLIDKNSIVISESLAKRLFKSSENALGKYLKWQVSDFKNQCSVMGVFEDVPTNSSDRFDIVMPMDAWREQMPGPINFEANGPSTYVLLKPGTDIENFNKKINSFMATKAQSPSPFFAKRYSENYLYGKYVNGMQQGGRIEYVRLFMIIAISILLIACINFMNLSTAKASRRIKEVGIKKAVGANRKMLIFHYLSESIVMSSIALLTAFIIVQFLLPYFNIITGKQLILSFDWLSLLFFLGVTLSTGILAGAYPAFYLSGFNTAKVLNKNFTSAVGSAWMRKGLVVFQFSISIIFIVSVIFIYNQVEFIQNKDIGFEKNNIIYFEVEGRVAQHGDTFIQELKNIPGVINASSMIGNVIGAGSATDIEINEKKIPFNFMYVNYGLLETLGIEMAMGRTYSSKFSDSTSIIVNEEAIRTAGLTAPISQKINFNGHQATIIGVTKNFHLQSLHNPIRPVAILLDRGRQWNIMAKIEAGKEIETLSAIKKFYKQYNNGLSLEYRFLDQECQVQYEREARVALLSRYFTILAISISCLGLFGLACFTVERRMKEIGIRKVFGSTKFDIIWLLAGGFTKMIFASMVIAFPVSFFIVQSWLDSFAYRIKLDSTYFIYAGLGVLFIAGATISSQMVKASNASPSTCLKDE